MGLIYASTPIGALTRLPPDQRLKYFAMTVDLPLNLRKLFTSLIIAAYLRRLARDNQIPVEHVPLIALTILRVGVGEIPLAKLGVTLSAELKLPNDKAQTMAREVEKELFAPVMLELNKYLEDRKQKVENSGGKAQQAGARNVVNLKQPPKPVRPAANNLPKPGQFNK